MLKEIQLYLNGKIYTGNNRFASAIAVSDGKIVAVGTARELRGKYAGKELDLEGKTVIPGLNDSHQHLWLAGVQRAQVDLSPCRSVDEIIDLCRRHLAAHPSEAATGLYAPGWNQDHFTDPDKRMPLRTDLDRISTKIPIVLERVCGHILTANSKAVSMLKLNGSPYQFPGGTVVYGADGVPVGLFTESACAPVRSLIPACSEEALRTRFIEAAAYAASVGLTSVQSNDAGGAHPEKDIAEIVRMYSEGNIGIKYRAQVCFDSPELFESALKNGEYRFNEGFCDGLVTVGPLKLFKDGSLGARTALMRNEYADEAGNYGVESLSDAETDEFCRIADKYGVQVITHVIGDSAVEKVLDSYERVLRNGKNELRHSLVHCQITDYPLLERIARLGVYVQYQPIFLNCDLHTVADRVGKALASTSYAHATLMKLNGHMSFGTDWPVEDCNPFPNIYSAVTRKDLSGYPDGGFCPSEKISVEAAVDAYTVGSAECEFAEGVKGLLDPGYAADFTVLDRDIFTVPEDEIKQIKPIMTVVNGKPVFET